MKLSKIGPGLSYLFFADDLMLFAKANWHNLSCITNVLNEFAIGKSVIFYSKSVGAQRASLLSRVASFSQGLELGRYLRVPILHKRVTNNTCQSVIDRVLKKCFTWDAKSLSFVGRLTLI